MLSPTRHAVPPRRCSSQSPALNRARAPVPIQNRAALCPGIEPSKLLRRALLSVVSLI
jgi:hypothetical protein